MGLLDYFRSYFPAPRHHDTGRRLGPNELPPDILDDLEKSRRNQHPSSHFNNQGGENPNNDGFNDVDGGNREGFFPGHSYEFRTFHDIDREFQEAFQEMDNMFKGFFGGGGGPSFDFGFPPGQSFELLTPPPDNNIGNYDADTSASGKEKSLREKMLNENDDGNSGFATPFHDHFNDEDGHSEGGFSFRFHTPFFRNIFPSPFNHNPPPEIPPTDNQPRFDDEKREDQNLDNSLDSHSIDRILDSQTPQPPSPNELSPFGNRTPRNGMSSTFKFSTITKKINPDGSVETTSRKQDSEGNEEVTVTRNLGEQSHTTISKKNGEGEEEKVENFVNMEESDMEEFESKWKGGGEREKSPRDRLLTPQQRDDMVEWFSSWWKPKL